MKTIQSLGLQAIARITKLSFSNFLSGCETELTDNHYHRSVFSDTYLIRTICFRIVFTIILNLIIFLRSTDIICQRSAKENTQLRIKVVLQRLICLKCGNSMVFCVHFRSVGRPNQCSYGPDMEDNIGLACRQYHVQIGSLWPGETIQLLKSK